MDLDGHQLVLRGIDVGVGVELRDGRERGAEVRGRDRD